MPLIPAVEKILLEHKAKQEPKIEVVNLKFDKKVLAERVTERMRKYPDALTYDNIAKITGRARKVSTSGC